MSETVQVFPLPKITGYWQHNSSKYPDIVKIPMSDGKVISYHIDVEQPHPCFQAAMENISKMKIQK